MEWERGVCEPIAFTDRLLGDGDFKEALRGYRRGILHRLGREHGEPILSNDALNDARGHTIEGTDDIEESMLVVPMVFEGRSVGVIALSPGQQPVQQRRPADDDHLRRLRRRWPTRGLRAPGAAVGGCSAAAVAAPLLEINERLLSTLERAEVLETIADGLKAVVRYDNCRSTASTRGQQALVPVLTRERHEEEVRRYIVPFGQGLMGWAVEHGEPVLANDALTDERAMQIPGTPDDPEALVVVPLVADGDVIGCMNISRIGGQDVYFSDADFELVMLFGRPGLDRCNADAHQATRAETDALTGLGNHGAFQRTLAEVLASRRPGRGRPAPRHAAASRWRC